MYLREHNMIFPFAKYSCIYGLNGAKWLSGLFDEGTNATASLVVCCETPLNDMECFAVWCQEPVNAIENSFARCETSYNGIKTISHCAACHKATTRKSELTSI